MQIVRYKMPNWEKNPALTPVTLCPLGDIQWAGDEEDLAYDHLKEHIDLCLSLPHPLFLGMGDYIDFASPSNREHLKTHLYDTAKKVIANAGKFLCDDLFTRVLAETTGKWLGLLEGHHHHPVTIGKLKDGTDLEQDSDVYLSRLLKTRYLEEFTFGEISWPKGGKFHFVAFHGKGSSVFPWGPLNQLWRLVPNFHADLLLMGHQTKKAFAETDRLIFPESGNHVTHKTVKMVGTGGWTKGYVVGRKTYISAGGLSPVALGQPLIHLRPRIRNGRWEPGMTVES